MDYVALGRTGIRVSRLGLGGGGRSRLGVRTGRSERESIGLVQRALDRGINFIDTAERYGTESIIGQALRGRDRASVVLSTKKHLSRKSLFRSRLITPGHLRRGLEASLRRLGTDYLDIYHLHGLQAPDYDRAVETLIPELLELKAAGKIRAIGVTEAFNSDRAHAMLGRAVRDDCWDVIMVGFNILNQSARDRVLIASRKANIGVVCMFAVRAAFSQPETLRALVRELIESGQLDRSSIDATDPLGFLMNDGVATSLPDAAYRFCGDEPGIHSVLTGTGNVDHLEQNIASMAEPWLPSHARARLVSIFGKIDTLSGQ